MTIEAARQEFPHTKDQVYLDHAATGPLSNRVVNAMTAFIEQRSHGRIDNYQMTLPIIEEARQRLGMLLHTAPTNIEFTANTSAALSLFAEGLSLRPGDRIAIPACEFPANVYPFMNLKRKGVEIDFIPHHDGVVRLDDVAQALTPATRVLAISWVQFLSGYRVDLGAVKALCRPNGTLLCVDAIQGLGAFTLDVEAIGVDFLACGCQKWMLSDQGTAFLYATPEVQDLIQPFAGWMHGPVDWDNFFDYKLQFFPDARRFRQGTQNNLGITALNAALGLYLEVGPKEAETAVRSRADALIEGLEQLGLTRYGASSGEERSGIVTVHHPDVRGLHRALLAQRITVSVRNGLLRLAPTWYNTPDEIERTIQAIAAYRPGNVPS